MFSFYTDMKGNISLRYCGFEGFFCFVIGMKLFLYGQETKRAKWKFGRILHMPPFPVFEMFVNNNISLWVSVLYVSSVSSQVPVEVILLQDIIF